MIQTLRNVQNNKNNPDHCHKLCSSATVLKYGVSLSQAYNLEMPNTVVTGILMNI